MKEISPRIVGTEMEWPIATKLVGNAQFEQLQDVTPLVICGFPPDIARTQNGGMLGNGGRCYVDVGSRVEYATPEDTSFEGAVVNELAGEQIVIDSLTRFIKQTDKIDKAYVTKRVVDSQKHTWGYHVNLSADEAAVDRFSDKSMHLLALHLATSVPMLGSGAIYNSMQHQKEYSFGQKVLGLSSDYGAGTTGMSKPLINQREEPHSKDIGLARVHITSVDPHVSPWAAKMMLGTSSLVLRAIEQGRTTDLRLTPDAVYNKYDTYATALVGLSQLSAFDLSLSQKIIMENGRSMTPTEIQNEILAIVATTDHTDEEAEILYEWQRAVADMEQDVMLLRDRSDAVAKLGLMRAYADRNGLDQDDFSHTALRSIDAEYSKLATIDTNKTPRAELEPKSLYDNSVAARLRRSSMSAHMPPMSDVVHATSEPPTTTRAFGRGKAIQNGGVSAACWTSYVDNGEYFDTNNPFQAIP